MIDKGPLLTSAIIFYLFIGAAIFEILEEPNRKLAVSEYEAQKAKILQDHPCLKDADLDTILQVASSAAGQGVALLGDSNFNTWNWPNAVIFCATIMTTIGYGNVAPKTAPGRIFCVFYGLFGIPLCLTWISELGKFFGSRAKRFGQFLLRRGLSLRKAQFACTAIFLLWGLVVHLLIPPLVFMYHEGWSYVDGFYFSFVTLTTIGFGDLVTGVDPKMQYHVLYRFFVEMWIYLGLAWLSLFFNWNVHMVVEAHKALKKRRRRHVDGPQQRIKVEKAALPTRASNNVDIFGFLSEKQEGYNDLIKQIGGRRKSESVAAKGLSRSRSCSDNVGGNVILTYERSLRRKRHYSFSDHMSVAAANRASGLDPHLETAPDPEENRPNKDVPGEIDHTWSDKESQPLLAQEVNVTFVSEENVTNGGREDEVEVSALDKNTKSEGCDEEEEHCSSESERLIFTMGSPDHCCSKENLVKDNDQG